MAYKNTIISIASILTLGTACSKAPEYAAEPQSGTTEAAKKVDSSDNAVATPDKVANNEQKTLPAPVATPKTTTPTTPAPTVLTPAQINKAMLDSGRLVTQFNITNAAAWGTSTTARLKLKVAVDAAGAVIVPATLPAIEQIPAVKDKPADDAKFVGVTTLVSTMKICNDSGAAIYLHSQGNAPFKHGNGPIATGTCQQFLVDRLTATDGGSYDHTAGNNVANYVYLQIEKIGPDGNVVP